MMGPRVALVTGATGGIGRVIALRMAKDQLNVAISDLPGTPLEALASEIEATGSQAHVVFADVSDEMQVMNMVASVVQHLGSLDVMISNAGILKVTPLFETSVLEFDHIMNVNARGMFLCYKYAGRQMVSQGKGGRIIGACSAAGIQGDALIHSYTASKFAVRGLTQSVAAELATHRITVNAYAPGPIDVGMGKLESLAGGADPLAVAEMEEIRKKYIGPVGRMGTAEDVAHAVSYLASEGSGFVTGQVISVNGGLHFA